MIVMQYIKTVHGRDWSANRTVGYWLSTPTLSKNSTNVEFSQNKYTIIIRNSSPLIDIIFM